MNRLHSITTGIFCLLAAAAFSLPSAQAAEAPTPKEIAERRSKAEKGDAHAQFSLGVCYELGQGVPKDEVEAVKWYRKAAEQRDFIFQHFAQSYLGDLYAKGQGVPKDDEEAVKWYRKAAERGYTPAQHSLGISYANGRGVPKDEAEAVKWWRKAAEQGLAEAQTLLGFSYSLGEGVPKDMAEAYKWYLLAGAQGNELAKKQIESIERVLTGAQRAEGQRLAREWKPSNPKIKPGTK